VHSDVLKVGLDYLADLGAASQSLP
jgi:hypothetical protein